MAKSGFLKILRGGGLLRSGSGVSFWQKVDFMSKMTQLNKCFCPGFPERPTCKNDYEMLWFCIKNQVLQLFGQSHENVVLLMVFGPFHDFGGPGPFAVSGRPARK